MAAAVGLVPRKSYIVPLPGGRALALGERTLVMGVVNVTPDSFADGRAVDPRRSVDEALALVEEGADVIDVGGESTRPGAAPVSADEELARVLPVLRGLRGRAQVPVSIDTYKADVARAALAEGASLVNDISGLRYDPALAGVIARAGAAAVLMHTRGRSNDMYAFARYADLPGEVSAELATSVAAATGAGIPRNQIIVDPGLGFAKRAEHTLEILARLDLLAALDLPLLVGPSRKSFLRVALGDVPPADRDWGTAAAVTAAVLLGAHIVRVHAVREMVQVARVADAIRKSWRSDE
jgi:dihydropteroate synthase